LLLPFFYYSYFSFIYLFLYSIKFNEAINDFLNDEIDLDFKKISVDELDDVKIEPAKIALIDWLFDI